eukprot:scaffold20662_cov101-Isochrysis_galbana.AAC.5
MVWLCSASVISCQLARLPSRPSSLMTMGPSSSSVSERPSTSMVRAADGRAAIIEGSSGSWEPTGRFSPTLMHAAQPRVRTPVRSGAR